MSLIQCQWRVLAISITCWRALLAAALLNLPTMAQLQWTTDPTPTTAGHRQTQKQTGTSAALHWQPSDNLVRNQGLNWYLQPLNTAESTATKGSMSAAGTSLTWEQVPQEQMISTTEVEAPDRSLTLKQAEQLAAQLAAQKKAYSRGSMIQIGDTIYPNLGFNALQNQPGNWVSAAIAAIDNSFQGTGSASVCSRGDFSSPCADALAEFYVRLWNSKAFSLDLQWTVHSLSGGPFSILGRTGGTSFGEGQSLGFKLSKNFTPTFGISFGGNRLFHLDQTTDLPKNLYLIGTKVFRLNQKIDAPIISLSLGLMSDIANLDSSIGTMQYPSWLLGGLYPSSFAEAFSTKKSQSGYNDVAGVSSAFVCANESFFIGKPLSAANPNCIKQVLVGPVGSIGIAPWPWLGFYAIFTDNVNFGLSLKPFKKIPWTISLEAVRPISGINKLEDDYFRAFPCAGQDLSSCRTRIGLFTNISF